MLVSGSVFKPNIMAQCTCKPQAESQHGHQLAGWFKDRPHN